MRNKLVSVVMPLYNDGNTVMRAIESVFNQTYSDFELVIVEDCSTDNSLSVVKRVKDKRLVLIEHGVNKERSAARNSGIKKASGHYVAFLDADDEWLPNKLERQVKYLESKNNKDWKAVVCNYYLSKDGKGNEMRVGREGNLMESLLMGDISLGAGSTLLIERSVLLDLGLYNEKHSHNEDIELMLKYFKKYKLAVLNEPLARVYGHNSKRDPMNMLKTRKEYLSYFSRTINEMGGIKGKAIYAKQWLSLAREFSIQGDIVNTMRYSVKSLSYKLLRYENSLIPSREYIVIINALVRSLLKKLLKNIKGHEK